MVKLVERTSGYSEAERHEGACYHNDVEVCVGSLIFGEHIYA